MPASSTIESPLGALGLQAGDFGRGEPTAVDKLLRNCLILMAAPAGFEPATFCFEGSLHVMENVIIFN
jgi:hypothetical protein